MLLGLSVHAVVCCYIQNRSICLAGSGDHVLDEVTVTRCVDDCEVVLWSEEFLVSDVNSNPSLPLLLQSVHDVGETETGLPSL